MASKVLLRQVQICNYKNIATTVVDPQPLTVLVGPNGAGKSNFVDALAFVSDSPNPDKPEPNKKKHFVSGFYESSGSKSNDLNPDDSANPDTTINFAFFAQI